MNLTGKVIGWYFWIIVGLYIVILFAVLGFSAGHSTIFISFLTVLSLVMVILGSVMIPFIDKGLFPIIPNRRFWGGVFALMLVVNVAYFFVGEEMIADFRFALGLSKKEATADFGKRTISPGRLYSVRGGKVYLLVENSPERTGYYLGESHMLEGGRIKFLKFRLDDPAIGPEAWVPASRAKEIKDPSALNGGPAGNGSGGSWNLPFTLPWNQELNLTPTELLARNVDRSCPGKMFIDLTEFSRGAWFVLLEDFIIYTPDPSTIVTLWFGGKGALKEWTAQGSYIKIPAGTCFQFKGDGHQLMTIVASSQNFWFGSNFHAKQT